MTAHTDSPSSGVESTQTEGSPMTSRTYQPTGAGLCGECGRDVGRHEDPAHRFEPTEWAPGCDYRYEDIPDSRAGTSFTVCRLPKAHHVHDVGRELRCPEEKR